MSAAPPPLPNELSYATPMSSGRPGYLTAVGIISIVIGALSGAWNALSLVSVLFMLTFLGNARLTSPSISSPTAPGSTTLPTTKPAAFPSANPSAGAGFLTQPYIANAVVEFLSVAAAAVLIVGGIQLLRDRSIARTFHWWFVRAKVIITILGAGATVWTYAATMNNSARLPFSGAGPLWLIAIMAGIGAVSSLAYPIALMIALSRPTAKSYFAELTRPDK